MHNERVTAPGGLFRDPVSRGTQVILVVVCVLAAAVGVVLLAPGPSTSVTVEGTGIGPVNPGPHGVGVTNGGVAGSGHFTLAGAIHDEGTYTDYRRVRGHIATVRKLLVGTRGTITIVITIHLGSESLAPWTITDGTRRYSGIRGKGVLTVDNYQGNPYTFVMTGTVSL